MKTIHFRKRATERGIDEITLSILTLFGEALDKRQGLTLSKNTYRDLKSLALSTKRGGIFPATDC